MNAGKGRTGRFLSALREELGAFRPRPFALGLVSRLVPAHTGGEARALLLRLQGVSVGTGTVFQGTPEFSGGHSLNLHTLSIGDRCTIGVGCLFELGAPITIGHDVEIGHQVMIITSTHELGPREHRAGPVVVRPITIDRGVLIGSRAIILPGVTLGEGSIVDAGSVVTKDVAPHTRVRGTPARQVEDLAPPAASAPPPLQ